MKRWLALNRWRILLSVGVIIVLRVVVTLVYVIADLDDHLPVTFHVVVVTVFNLAICVAAIATVVAFVQYGRIFNPRIPTE